MRLPQLIIKKRKQRYNTQFLIKIKFYLMLKKKRKLLENYKFIPQDLYP
jgi:hypothetical protein